MRRLFILLLLISSIPTFGQLPQGKYSPINGPGFIYKRHVQDSLSVIPLSTSPHIPYRPGGIRYNDTCECIEVWNGTHWKKNAGANLANDSLTANFDYTHNWAQRQLFIDSIRALRLSLYAPGASNPNNNFRMRLEGKNALIDPLFFEWALQDQSSQDSIGGGINSGTFGTVINNYSAGMNKFSEVSVNGIASNPNVNIEANNTGFRSKIFLDRSIYIQANDSTHIQALPAATADSGLGIRSTRNVFGYPVSTVVKFPLPPTLSPGGSNTQLQFNNSGTFGGTSNMTWDETNTGLTIQKDGLGMTQTNTSGLILTNNTAAASAAQQISPAIRWRGFGWKTDATAASQPVDFRAYVVPTQSSFSALGAWHLQAAINEGSYATRLLVNHNAITGEFTSSGLRLAGGGISIASTTPIANNFNWGSSTFTFASTSTTSSAQDVLTFGGTGNATTGTTNFVRFNHTFSPTSGTGAGTTILVAPTINQTGGANGITRGIHINPTLTVAADFRALEIAAGKTILNGDNVLIGTATDNGAKLQVEGDATVADEAYDATNWNGSLEVPTKNAIRDKIEGQTLNGSLTHDFGTIANNSSATTTVSVTGAADGDFVLVTKPVADGWSNGESYTAWVSGADTVTVRQNNNSGGSAGFGSQTIKVKVIKQ